MKKALFTLALLGAAQCLTAQLLSAANPEPTDTLTGICVLIGPGGTATYDTTTNTIRMTSDPEGVIFPKRCICTRTPIELVPPDLRGMSVGYVHRFFLTDDGTEIPPNDVIVFKIRTP